jgi:hypothetical protein
MTAVERSRRLPISAGNHYTFFSGGTQGPGLLTQAVPAGPTGPLRTPYFQTPGHQSGHPLSPSPDSLKRTENPSAGTP